MPRTGTRPPTKSKRKSPARKPARKPASSVTRGRAHRSPQKLAALRRQILKRNREFEKMTRTEKRLTIARDVIDCLSGRGPIRFVAAANYYFKGTHIDGVRNDQLQDKLLELPQCSGCAKSALLVCAVLRHNDYTLDQATPAWQAGVQRGQWVAASQRTKRQRDVLSHVHSDDMDPYMADFFDANQWDLIEAVFEKLAPITWEYDPKRRWNQYPIASIKSAHDRMIAIMENIIRNQGTFRPEQPLPTSPAKQPPPRVSRHKS